ncbi:MAG TPA: hypothetical protein VND95_10410 [Stellaceae bacterium]|nr:hypothetical protein [Stellaceae bacterium]
MKELTISGAGIPPFLVRDVTQSLSPIKAATNFGRAANGQLIASSPSQFQKYRSTITCISALPESLIWPGTKLTIGCAQEWSFKTSGGSPLRPVVAGSLRTEDDRTYYSPILEMLVTDFYNVGGGSWTLELEEV